MALAWVGWLAIPASDSEVFGEMKRDRVKLGSQKGGCF